MAKEPFPYLKWEQLLVATQKTLCMTALSGATTFILGIAFGLTSFLTAYGGLFPNRTVYSAISLAVNIFRLIPLIILVVLLIPFTRAMAGTILGANTALPAPIVRAVPPYARLAEIVLREVDKDVIEAACSTGVRLSTLIFRVLLPESSPALVSRVTVTLTALASYSTMAGVIGAGDLGNLAYLEGFRYNHSDVTLVVTVTILFTVFIIQFCDDAITSLLDER